jgi:hypothetical protein
MKTNGKEVERRSNTGVDGGSASMKIPKGKLEVRANLGFRHGN